MEVDTMKATFNDFLMANPSCNGFSSNSDAECIFKILSKDENIISMVEAIEQGRPGLEPCVSEIENWYENTQLSDVSLNDEFTRKAIGRMVKTVLEPFGYEVSSRKAISKNVNSKFFKTASCYEKTGKARLKVVKKIVEV